MRALNKRCRRANSSRLNPCCAARCSSARGTLGEIPSQSRHVAGSSSSSSSSSSSMTSSAEVSEPEDTWSSLADMEGREQAKIFRAIKGEGIGRCHLRSCEYCCASRSHVPTRPLCVAATGLRLAPITGHMNTGLPPLRRRRAASLLVVPIT